LNERIKSETVRLVHDDGNALVNTRLALEKAKAEGLDLVCVAPEANPPVCKIYDYNLEAYRRRQALKVAKKQQQKNTIGQTKEIKLKGLIEDHDLNVKCDKINEALSKFHPVRVIMTGDGKMLRKKPDCLVILPGRILSLLGERSSDFTVQSQSSKRLAAELILMPSKAL
jgi:translation initiation factor IF-3